jgi:MerR family transcriptional regulator, mercuric resistance operon regulatory protein
MKRGLSIGQVACEAGVNVQTLRYYERRGILEEPKRSASGYREYSPDTVRLIRFIKRAQDLGFTLSEIEELLELREHRPRERQAARELAAAKVRDIEEKVRDLESMKRALNMLVASCACKGGTPECPILEALEGATPEAVPRSPGQARSRKGMTLDLVPTYKP